MPAVPESRASRELRLVAAPPAEVAAPNDFTVDFLSFLTCIVCSSRSTMAASTSRPLEYLEGLPGTTFYKLYQQPSTALAIFRRMLPDLGIF